MHPYLTGTEYAVRQPLELATSEKQRLSGIDSQFQAANVKFQHFVRELQFKEISDDACDVQLNAAHARMAKAHHERESLKTELNDLRAQVDAHQESYQAVAGAVLQIAKQGISFAYGTRAQAPGGRAIGNCVVRDIVWEGRNQAIHYEGKLKDHVTDFFAILANEHGDAFDLKKHPNGSRAIQILDLLNWNDYDQFVRDMQQILN